MLVRKATMASAPLRVHLIPRCVHYRLTPNDLSAGLSLLHVADPHPLVVQIPGQLSPRLPVQLRPDHRERLLHPPSLQKLLQPAQECGLLTRLTSLRPHRFPAAREQVPDIRPPLRSWENLGRHRVDTRGAIPKGDHLFLAAHPKSGRFQVR